MHLACHIAPVAHRSKLLLATPTQLRRTVVVNLLKDKRYNFAWHGRQGVYRQSQAELANASKQTAPHGRKSVTWEAAEPQALQEPGRLPVRELFDK